MKTVIQKAITLVAMCGAIASTVVIIGCTKREKSTATGAVIGGGSGALIGGLAGGPVGAGIGAGAGLGVGAIIGNQAGK